MSPRVFEYFFDLPAELREQILSHVCLFPTGILVGGGPDGVSVPLPISDSSTATTTAAAAKTTGETHLGDGGEEVEEAGAGGDDDDDEDDDPTAGPPINLFLASPVLYREACDLYYGRNVFHFDFASASWGRRQQSRAVASASAAAITGGDGCFGVMEGIMGRGLGHSTAATMRLLTHPATANARRRVRSVVVRVRRLGALLLDVLVPALRDMVLNGSLKRARVDVLEAGAGGGRRVALGEQVRLRALDHQGNPALRALLVLLADPDMERAELRVPKRLHARFWCRFHEGGVSDGMSTSLSCAMAGEPDGDGDEYLQVDIHRLVETCAGDAAEFRIKRVGLG